MPPTDYLTLIHDYGLTAFLLVVLFIEGRIVCRWIGDEVIKPVVRAHKAFLIGMQKLQHQTNKILQQLCGKIDDLARAREALTRQVNELLQEKPRED